MSPRQPGECSVCGQAIPPTASSCPVCGGRSIFVSTEINVTGGLIPYGNMKALLSYYIAMCGVFPCLFPAGLIGLVLGLLGLAHAKAHPEARGRYHAYAGIFCGVLFGFGWPVLYFSGLLNKLDQLIRSLF